MPQTLFRASGRPQHHKSLLSATEIAKSSNHEICEAHLNSKRHYSRGVRLHDTDNKFSHSMLTGKKEAPNCRTCIDGEIDDRVELDCLYRTDMTGCWTDSKKNTEERPQNPPSEDTPHREAQDEDTRRLRSHHKFEECHFSNDKVCKERHHA